MRQEVWIALAVSAGLSLSFAAGLAVDRRPKEPERLVVDLTLHLDRPLVEVKVDPPKLECTPSLEILVDQAVIPLSDGSTESVCGTHMEDDTP